MFLLLQGHIPERTIQEAVEQVFRSPAYGAPSLWQQIKAWFFGLLLRFLEWIALLFGARHRAPLLFWAVVTIIALLLVGAIARVIWLWRERRAHAAEGLPWERAALRKFRGDPWALSAELSARGEYTDAAHALYLALLEAAARQRQLRLHPSKTAGDYVRELRAQSSHLLLRFRDFARSYELVIYGLGECDRERYERLHALALPIVRAHG